MKIQFLFKKLFENVISDDQPCFIQLSVFLLLHGVFQRQFLAKLAGNPTYMVNDEIGHAVSFWKIF